MKLKIGMVAPHFSALDQDGVKHDSNHYRGSWVLLYFYPKDNTPGCTTEACSIRDAFEDFNKANITVLGVSTDSAVSHKRFIKKYELPFTLLADEDKAIVKLYGVWGKKSFLGNTFLGTKRMSFLIDPKGRIAKVYEKVAPAEHANEVLADMRLLSKKNSQKS